jgi:hypothetical protein
MVYEKASRSSNPEVSLLDMVEKNPRLGKLLEPSVDDALTVLRALSGIRQTKGTGNALLQKPVGPLEKVTGSSFQSFRRTLVGSILSTPSKVVRISGDYADKASSDKLAASRLAMLVDPSVMAQEAAFIRAHGVTDASKEMMANVLMRSVRKAQKLWAEGDLKGAALGVAKDAAVGAAKGVVQGTNVPQAVNEATSDGSGFQPIGGSPEEIQQ